MRDIEVKMVRNTGEHEHEIRREINNAATARGVLTPNLAVEVLETHGFEIPSVDERHLDDVDAVFAEELVFDELQQVGLDGGLAEWLTDQLAPEVLADAQNRIQKVERRRMERGLLP